MKSTKFARLSSVALIAAGASLAVVPAAQAATPAPAFIPCIPGTAAYPPGVCTYSFNFFVPIQVVTHGNTITITIDGLAPFDVVLFWLSPDVAATATTDAHGQAHVTVNTASLPAGAQTLSAKAANGTVGTTNFTVAPEVTGSVSHTSSGAPTAATADVTKTLVAASGPGQTVPQSAAATRDAQAIVPAGYVAPKSESSSYVLPSALVGGALMLAGAGVVVGRRRKSDPQY